MHSKIFKAHHNKGKVASSFGYYKGDSLVRFILSRRMSMGTQNPLIFKQFRLIGIIGISIIFIIASCGPAQPYIAPTDVVNFYSIRTDVFEDGSGKNTFVMVIPDRADCQGINLKAALAPIKQQDGGQVSYHSYNANGFIGVELTYRFRDADEIPAQIETLQQALVEAAISATPIPIPTPGEPTPLPPIAEKIEYDPNRLAIEVRPTIETLTGKKWNVSVTLNPFELIEGPDSSDSSKSCKVPTIVYEITLPGEITNFNKPEVTVDKNPDLLEYSYVEITGSNTVRWILEVEQAEEALASEIQALFDEYENLTPEQQEEQGTEFEERLSTLLETPPFTLTVTSSTAGSVLKFFTLVVGPILALIGSIIAIVTAISKIVQRKKKSTENQQVAKI